MTLGLIGMYGCSFWWVGLMINPGWQKFKERMGVLRPESLDTTWFCGDTRV